MSTGGRGPTPCGMCWTRCARSPKGCAAAAQRHNASGDFQEKRHRMSWLTEYVRPKIRTLFARREVPDNLWRQCPECQQMIFHVDLEKNLKVCPHCGHHIRPTVTERLGWT